MVMYCWKCGQELTDGASACVYCGANQRRPEPTSEAGRAMRQLYDRYGRDAVLTNNLMLVNGLGDLVENSQKLRNQLKMALDAGVGRLYLDQLNGTGAPDAAFDQRVRALMSDEAGLNDKAIYEITDCFDDMIGWRAASEARPASKAQPQPAAETHEETDRATGKAYRKPEPTPAPQPEPPKNGEGGRIVAVIIALLVLLGGGFLAYKHVMGPDVTGTWYLNAVTKGATTSDPADDGRYAALTLNKDGSAEYVTKVYGNGMTQSGSWKNSFGTLTLELEGADSLMKAEGDTLSFRDAEGSQLAFGRDITVAPTPTPKPTIKPSPTPKPTVKPTPTPKPTAKPTPKPAPILKSVKHVGDTTVVEFSKNGIHGTEWELNGYIGSTRAVTTYIDDSDENVYVDGDSVRATLSYIIGLIPGHTYQWTVSYYDPKTKETVTSNSVSTVTPQKSSGTVKMTSVYISSIKRSDLIDLFELWDRTWAEYNEKEEAGYDEDEAWEMMIAEQSAGAAGVFDATLRLSKDGDSGLCSDNIYILITWPSGKRVSLGLLSYLDFDRSNSIREDVVDAFYFSSSDVSKDIETGTYLAEFYDCDEQTYLGSTTFTVTQG